MCSIARIRVEHENLFKSPTTGRVSHSKKNYKSLYGLSLFQIYVLMSYFRGVKHPAGYSKFSPKHVLWSLYFLKNYPLRLTAARTFGVSERTFDKYVWYCIRLISEVDNVSKVIHCDVRMMLTQNFIYLD